MITKKTIDAVFDAARVDDVVQDFLNLKPRGSNMIGLCPFHDEKTPSFAVSPTKNIYKCFGCGRGGGPVQFVMEHEKYTYPEAIRYLAKKYNIEIEETEQTDADKAERQEIESLHLVNQFAHETFVSDLFNSSEGKAIGLSYFKERGFLESTIRRFELGYALNQPDALRSRALDAGYSEERLAALGLLTKNGKDFFRGRVIFPIHNLSGKVVGFGGRVLKQSARGPKYLNSPESQVYNKRKTLYGLHLAKHAVRKQDLCYLVEGYTDVISLSQSGIENVVASSGTALTNDQIRAIKRFTPNVTVLYDADPAGIKAAMRGLDLMLAEDMNVRLVLLPENKDPDTMATELGAAEFKKYLEEAARDFILFKTGFLNEKSANDPVQRSSVIRDIVNSIALVPDPIKRATYIQQCSLQLSIDEQILIDETNAAIRGNLKKASLERKRSGAEVRADFNALRDQKHASAGPDAVQQLPAKGQKAADEYQERAIARILILFGAHPMGENAEVTVAGYVLEKIADVADMIENPVYQSVVQAFREGLEVNEVPTPERLVANTDSEISRLAVEMIQPPFEYSENWLKMKQMPLVTQKPPDENFIKDTVDVLLRFKRKKILRKIEENKALVLRANESGDEDRLAVRMKVHSELLLIKAQVEEQLNTIGIQI